MADLLAVDENCTVIVIFLPHSVASGETLR
jgi:hypothetical protein